MSEENVDVVRRALDAWQPDDLDLWLPMHDPDVEWQPALERLVEGTGSYRGLDGMRVLWGVYRTEFEDFRLTADEIDAASAGEEGAPTESDELLAPDSPPTV